MASACVCVFAWYKYSDHCRPLLLGVFMFDTLHTDVWHTFEQISGMLHIAIGPDVRTKSLVGNSFGARQYLNMQRWPHFNRPERLYKHELI